MQKVMTKDTADSLRNLCRACMSSITSMKGEGPITNYKQCISEKPIACEEGPTIMDLLQKVLPFTKVQLEEDLPNSMCIGCIQQLQLTHDFLEMFKESDDKFRKLLKEVFLEEEVSYQKVLDDNFEEICMERERIDDAKITKFEIEIENLGETISMQRDTLEIDDDYENGVNNWLECEDEPMNNNDDNVEDDPGKSEVIDNPYSDTSDNEYIKEYIRSSQQAKAPSPKSRKDRTQKCANKKSLTKPSKEKNDIAKLLPAINDDGSIECQECEIMLENYKQWKEHMRVHRLEKLNNSKEDPKVGRPKKMYKCEYCNKEFQKTTAYKNHIRVHTGEEPYLCIECGKSFKVVSSLNTHMLRHKGEKTIQCPQCPKKFVCSSGLYGHMMVHNKEKPFVCDICGSAFHMAYMLKKHNLYHKGIRNFPCEYCDLRFVTAEKQRRHMRTHTGEKPYRCKYCDRAFAQSNDCNKHMKQHLGENIFQCELCPLRFPLVRELRVHFATHKDDDEETRGRNLAARAAEEESLKIKLGIKDDK